MKIRLPLFLFAFVALLSVPFRAVADPINTIVLHAPSPIVALAAGDPDDPFVIQATIGTTVSSGEFGLFNPLDVPLFLLGDSFNASSPLTVDDSPFLATFPLSIAPGDTVMGTLFNVTVPAGTTPGIYDLSFTILGGFGPNDPPTPISDPINFQINAQPAPIPEPGTWLLLVTGIGGLGTVVYTRRRQASFGQAA